jgi:probable addiction module antidote protein
LAGIEDVDAYLEAALDEGGDDPAAVAQALGAIARSGNMSELARRVGMNREGLYKALSADGNPSFATTMKVAKALGLKQHFESVA